MNFIATKGKTLVIQFCKYHRFSTSQTMEFAVLKSTIFKK